ncbi:hypothetical protein [Sedimenticola selenatireducens]|nr:hypothetical protein [Sedimenticola selenatireducens]
MYHWISKKLPPSFAVPAAALIYALMLLLILYFSFEEEAKFNYLVL